MPTAATTRDPIVTVLMPVRNPDPRFFPAAVQSVLDQTLADFELIIVEDVGERAAAEDLAAFDDPRILHLANEGPGSMASARTRGLAASRAQFVAMFDADDICHPERLARQVERLEAEPDLAVLGTQLQILDDDGRSTGYRSYPLDHETIVATLRRYNTLAHPSVMVRKAVIAAEGYRERVCEDYDLWCRLAKSGVRFANLEEPLLSYRVHGGATKSRRLKESLADTIALKREHWNGQLRFRERMRLVGERALMRLPPSWVMFCFDRLSLRGRRVGMG